MRGWQEWIVVLLLAYCTVRILLGIASFWRRSKKKNVFCSSCPTPCELKDLNTNRCRKPAEGKKEKKKKCCG